jgi:hypothetical protein
MNTTKCFTVTFTLESHLSVLLIEREYQRLETLKQMGIFKSLNIYRDRSGGDLKMLGSSEREIETALQSLPLCKLSHWTISEFTNDEKP